MTTRRNFLKTATLASAGLAVGLRANAGNAGSNINAGGKVNLACIGIGNRGEQIIDDFDKTGLANVVALCDVDLGAEHTQKMLVKFPKAKQFKDFRQLFDKMGNEIEAVCIAVPDHAHFPISMLAVSLGKHVYVEKPMAQMGRQYL
jgi:predicted dehydrogenase